MGLSQNELLDLLDHFEKDSLHVTPSNYTNIESYINDGIPLSFNGTEIPKITLSPYNIYDSHAASTEFYALDKVDFGSSLYGMIVGVKTENVSESKIAIWIINTESNSIIEKVNLAYYKKIPGTMEELMNAWILDLDEDGDLDIAVMISLTDYELPNEFSDNISGVEGYGYYIQEGKVSYDYLSQENYQRFAVKL